MGERVQSSKSLVSRGHLVGSWEMRGQRTGADDSRRVEERRETKEEQGKERTQSPTRITWTRS